MLTVKVCTSKCLTRDMLGRPISRSPDLMPCAREAEEGEKDKYRGRGMVP
jgi:hypothetical protein